MPKEQINKVILAYTGGLDTSIIVPWLKDNYGCEVICFTADLGQEELENLEQKALASGASQVIIEDLKEEFAEEYLFRLLRSGAVYENKYFLGAAIARPLVAAHQVALAHKLGADGVAHGATGKGNDQVRFELAYAALDPRLRVISPWREWNIRSRKDAIHYAEEHNVPVIASEKTIYSRDRNIWHLSHEGGKLEDAWAEPPESIYLLTASPENAPDEPQTVEITFDQAVPVAVNGIPMKPAKIITHLNSLGGTHGIGRVDMIESRLIGLKSHGVYETPGGTILHAAIKDLEALVLDRETLHFKEIAALKYAELVYNGFWFSTLRYALDNFFEGIRLHICGTVKMKLFKGNIIPIGRKSPYSLYREEFATYGENDIYDQKAAEGFIRLYGLPLKVRALTQIPMADMDIPKPDYSLFKRD